MDEKIQEVREALAARSHTATLDELRSRGKRAVRVIKTDDVAQMIGAAVNQALASSGLMAPDEVEGLIERSRAEFQEIVARRQMEAEETERLQHEVSRLQSELKAARLDVEVRGGDSDEVDGLKATLEQVQRELDRARLRSDEVQGELDQLRGEMADTEGELKQARADRAQAMQQLRSVTDECDAAVAGMAEARQRIAGQSVTADELEQVREERVQAMQQLRSVTEERDSAVVELAKARQKIGELETALEVRAEETPATVGAGINADLVFRMMNEIADLRARTGGAAAAPVQPAPQAAPQPAAAGGEQSAAIASALEQMTASFTSKLESLGKRMGVSAAVESKGPDLGGLFSHADGDVLESNIDSVKVTSKSGTGIAANLARLKKLKGGG